MQCIASRQSKLQQMISQTVAQFYGIQFQSVLHFHKKSKEGPQIFIQRCYNLHDWTPIWSYPIVTSIMYRLAVSCRNILR
jgi:hypothetical protein